MFADFRRLLRCADRNPERADVYAAADRSFLQRNSPGASGGPRSDGAEKGSAGRRRNSFYTDQGIDRWEKTCIIA